MAPEKKNPQRLFIKDDEKGSAGRKEGKGDVLKRILQGFPPLEGELILLDDRPRSEMSYGRLYRAVEAQTDDIQSGDQEKGEAWYRERKVAVIRDLMRKVGPNKGTLILIDEGTDETTGSGKDTRSQLLAVAMDEFKRTLRQMQIVEVLRPMLEGYLKETALEQTGKPVEKLNDVEFYRVVRNFVAGKASEK
jgi:hypothetical protein